MRPSAIVAPVREFFLLSASERVILAYTPRQHARVAELRAAGEERLAAAGRAASLVAACVLLREGVSALVRARAVARDAHLEDAALAALDVAVDLPELPPDPLDGSSGDTARARLALASQDALFFDRLDPAERIRTRTALERTAAALRRRVEARSLLHVRAQRWGRLAALVVLLLYGVWLGVRGRIRPVNIAVGKHVHVSSYRENPPDGHELVDGRPGFSFAVMTNTEDSPSVVIDLAGDHAIDRIAVTNRSDGWWEDCLPLVVELSRDGRTYTELARRETYFGFVDPWVIPAAGRMARFVRVRVARKSYLALGRVEIFGTP